MWHKRKKGAAVSLRCYAFVFQSNPLLVLNQRRRKRPKKKLKEKKERKTHLFEILGYYYRQYLYHAWGKVFFSELKQFSQRTREISKIYQKLHFDLVHFQPLHYQLQHYSEHRHLLYY